MAQSEIVERENTAPVADSSSILAIISRAAADPNTNIDKMERLMAMYERVESQRAKAAYFAALSDMQDELPTIQERGEIKINENKPGQKYALWEDINKAIKPILKEHGFAISFRTGQAESKITVTGILSHKGGHSEETTIHLPSDTSGSKNAVQAVGSSTSYGKRYTASALLNLTSGGDDDDGAAAGGNGLISDAQLDQITDMLAETDSDIPRFCKFMAVKTVADIRAKDFNKAVSAIKAKGGK